MGKRIAAIIIIYIFICAAWMVLGGVMSLRSNQFGSRLSHRVAGLWGQTQIQEAPRVDFTWNTREKVKEEVIDPKTNKSKVIIKDKVIPHTKSILLDSSDIMVNFDLAHRKKGLLWYSTYLVNFEGNYSFVHDENINGTVTVSFRFPTHNATYDDFQFVVYKDGEALEMPDSTQTNQSISQYLRLTKGQRVDFQIAYTTRGLDFWRYNFGQNVNRVKDFSLAMTTNFTDIDFPDGSISPTTKAETGSGWDLDWEFKSLISGFDIGMVMPKKLNPGPLAAQISLFAPVSLAFFFVWMFVITLLKKIDLHPINYLFLAASFFSFHLLMAYTVDHLSLTLSFIISSGVSIVLLVSYLRLAVGMRFAAMEAGLSQIVYLILFSYAHLYEGWTGLMVTIGSVLTLFFIMQLTGRINWTAAFSAKQLPRPAKPTVMDEC